MSVLEEQTRELAIPKDAETPAPGKVPICSPRLAQIDSIMRRSWLKSAFALVKWVNWV